MASLKIIAGPWRNKTFELPENGGEMLVGRENGHIAMHDVRVSRKHAKVTYRNGWYLRDLGSSNGTFVNEKRLRGEVKLKHNDQVRFGSTFLLFEDAAQEPPMIQIEPADAIEQTQDAPGETVVGFEMRHNGGDLLGEKLAERIGAIITASTERDKLLAGVIEVFVQELAAACGFVLVRDFAAGRFETAAQHCDNRSLGDVPIDSAIVEEVLAGDAVVVEDMEEYRQTSRGRTAGGAKSVMCVPMRAGASVIGAIYLTSDQARAFTDKQAKVCEQAAGEIGLAIENIRLNKEIAQRERVAAAGQTAVNLSHGVKNLLQAIGGASDVVEVSLEKKDWKRAKRGWNVLRRNLDRIRKLVLDMLEYTKESSPVLSGCDINRLVASAVNSLREEASAKNVAIKLKENGSLGTVQVDGDKMHDVVLNLVLNAIDAVEKDSGKVEVATNIDQAKSQIQITVADNGPGIENAETIFLPFHTSKTKVGTGLGLPIAKKIVEQHGGSIDVDSTPGQGAKFTVNLPLR